MKKLGVACVAVLLSACAATDWRHPDYREAGQRARQLRIDTVECEAFAANNTPGPVMVPHQQAYRVDGVSHSAGQSSAFSADVTPTGGGATAGLNRGTAIGTNFRNSRMRNDLVKACMYRRGWVELVG